MCAVSTQNTNVRVRKRMGQHHYHDLKLFEPAHMMPRESLAPGRFYTNVNFFWSMTTSRVGP